MLFNILSKVLMLAAILLIAGSVYGYFNIQKSLKNSDALMGTIVSVQSTAISGSLRPGKSDFDTARRGSWEATFSYTFRGKDYREASPVYYSDEDRPEIGMRIKIYVNKEEPKKFLINEFSSLYGLQATMGFFAFVMLFIAVPVHFLIVKDNAFQKPSQFQTNLKFTGKLIQAKVVRVEKSFEADDDGQLSDSALKFLGQTGVDPWTVYAEWQSLEDQFMHQFKSQGITEDPKLQKGDLVNVYLDRQNPLIYLMDVETGSKRRY